MQSTKPVAEAKRRQVEKFWQGMRGAKEVSKEILGTIEMATRAAQKYSPGVEKFLIISEGRLATLYWVADEGMTEMAASEIARFAISAARRGISVEVENEK